MKRKLLSVACTLVFFSGCATWEGIKTDTSTAGEAVSGTAKEAGEAVEDAYEESKQAIHEATE